MTTFLRQSCEQSRTFSIFDTRLCSLVGLAFVFLRGGQPKNVLPFHLFLGPFGTFQPSVPGAAAPAPATLPPHQEEAQRRRRVAGAADGAAAGAGGCRGAAGRGIEDSTWLEAVASQQDAVEKKKITTSSISAEVLAADQEAAKSACQEALSKAQAEKKWEEAQGWKQCPGMLSCLPRFVWGYSPIQIMGYFAVSAIFQLFSRGLGQGNG